MPELMTVDQVAELLRLNRQTIYNWIDAGTLEAMHIGRRVRIKRAVVDEMVKAGGAAAVRLSRQPRTSG